MIKINRLTLKNKYIFLVIQILFAIILLNNCTDINKFNEPEEVVREFLEELFTYSNIVMDNDSMVDKNVSQLKIFVSNNSQQNIVFYLMKYSGISQTCGIIKIKKIKTELILLDGNKSVVKVECHYKCGNLKKQRRNESLITLNKIINDELRLINIENNWKIIL